LAAFAAAEDSIGFGEMTELGQGREGVGHGPRRLRAALRHRQQEKPDHLGARMAKPAKGPADLAGHIEEHAAAGAAGQASRHVDPRPVGSQAEPGSAVTRRQGLGGNARLQLLAQPVGNRLATTDQRQSAERPPPPRRDLVARHPRQRCHRQPLLQLLPLLLVLHVMRGAMEVR
jgi:hypothetical protein